MCDYLTLFVLFRTSDLEETPSDMETWSDNSMETSDDESDGSSVVITLVSVDENDDWEVVEQDMDLKGKA